VRITSIETFDLDDQVAMVRVRTDDGAEGIGATSPFHSRASVQLLHSMVAPWFLGKDPWDLEALVAEFVRREYKFYGTFLFRALCGVETALWDLLGKVTGQPVYRLLGGLVREQVPVYGSSMSRTITPEAEAERMLGLMESNGFRCFKLRVGDVMGRDQDAAPRRTERIIGHVRQVLGPDIGLHADANSAYTVSRAITVGRLLEDNGYLHFEEPCPYPQLENTAKVAAALDIAVAGGEQDNSIEQFHRMITLGAVDIVQPDIGYIGGVSRARKVAVMAEAAGIPCTPHCSNRSMLQVFTLHLAAAMPSVTQYQEWTIEDNLWTRDLYEPVPEVIDGVVTMGAEPGWGVEIHPAVFERADHRISA
jgi:L-alanine-DL-glutamate epimerase-like enolase superfamily enzyme